MNTILGAGGAVSNELMKVFAARKQPFRLVSRRGMTAGAAAEAVSADLADKDQTLRAVAGSNTVYLLAGLQYNHRIWAEMWPRIIQNTIEACKRAGARLIFFDNVYMYGKVNGRMTEETPFHPISRKGEVRARIATALMDEWKARNITAMIARAADFYGPGAKNGVANALVFEPLSKGQKPMSLVSDVLPHSYTYVPDTAEALVRLAETESTWNQTWHLPTAPNPLTGSEFIVRAAQAMGKPAKHRVLSRSMVRIFGWFNPVVGEIYEMLYQNDSPYLFDSSKFANAFGCAATSYADGIVATAASYSG